MHWSWHLTICLLHIALASHVSFSFFYIADVSLALLEAEVAAVPGSSAFPGLDGPQRKV